MEEQNFWTFFEVHSLKCIGVLQNTMVCDMVIIQSHGIYQSVLVLLFCKRIHLINGIICSVLLFNFRCVKMDSTLFFRCCLLGEISRPSN